MLPVIEFREFINVAVIAAIALLVMSFTPESVLLLRYEMQSVNNGEWWRLISANFCHSNWNHLLLNLSGLLLIDYLFQPLLKQRIRASLLWFCIATNVLLLHWLISLQWYVGLSGALHGFLLGGALLSFKKAPRFNSLIIAIVVVKLSIELSWEINQKTADLIGANVVEESHLAGALVSLFFCGSLYIFRYLQSKKKRA